MRTHFTLVDEIEKYCLLAMQLTSGEEMYRDFPCTVVKLRTTVPL